MSIYVFRVTAKMNKSDLKAESLPHSSKTDYVSTLMREVCFVKRCAGHLSNFY